MKGKESMIEKVARIAKYYSVLSTYNGTIEEFREDHPDAYSWFNDHDRAELEIHLPEKPIPNRALLAKHSEVLGGFNGTRREFYFKCKGSYVWIKRHYPKMIEDKFPRLISARRSEEEHLEILNNFEGTRTELVKAHRSSYNYLMKHYKDLLDKKFPRLISARRSEEEHLEILNNFKGTRTEFIKAYKSSYNYLMKHCKDLLDKKFPKKKRG